MPQPETLNELPPRDGYNQSLTLVYAIYRQALTLVIWVLYLAGTGVGQEQPLLFLATAIAYLGVNTLLLYAAAINWQPSFVALLLVIASDIVAIQLIAQASGDIGSGISVLMIVSVATGSLFLKGSKAYIVAAFASITLLLSVTTGVLQDSAQRAEIAASGWLGFIFFLTSSFVGYLSKRLESSDLRARQEYEHAQNLLRLNSLIIERMQTGILVASSSGEVISFNASSRELLQLSPGAQPGTLVQIDPRLAGFLEKIVSEGRNLLSAGGDGNTGVTPNSQQLVIGGRNIKLVWIRLSDSDDSEYLVFIEDLSKLAQQAQQLKLSSLGKLTASIAHEIRNPLGAVSHAAQLLQMPDSETENQRLAEIIINQSQRCSEVIETILDVSRSGKSRISRFDLQEWLPGFLNDYRIGKDCDIRILGEPTLAIRFDPSQLAQILTNLLDNALRASEAAGQQRTAVLYTSRDQQQLPRLDILDLGTGVAVDDRGHLFEPFFTRSQAGSGLGLYICRELCEANQASISYLHNPFVNTHNTELEKFRHCFRIQFSHPDRAALALDELSTDGAS